MDYLLEDEITLAKRIWAVVLLIRAWMVWVSVIVFQVAFFAVINLLFDSYSSSDDISIPPILAQSKSLIQYSLGNRESLAKHVATVKDWEDNREQYEKEAQELMQASTQAELADPDFRKRMAIYTIVALIIVVGAFKVFGYI